MTERAEPDHPGGRPRRRSGPYDAPGFPNYGDDAPTGPVADLSAMPTHELPKVAGPSANNAAGPVSHPGGSQQRGVRRPVLSLLTGTLTAGLVLLTAGVIVAQLVRGARPGPGMSTVGAHVLGAVAAVLLQRLVDRRRGYVRLLAGVGVIAVVAAILWFFWWS